MPGTASTAPVIPSDALKYGESDLKLLGILIRFSPIGNLIGIPSGIAPLASKETGLSVGIQIMADHWNEHQIFKALQILEAAFDRPEPEFNGLHPLKRL